MNSFLRYIREAADQSGKFLKALSQEDIDRFASLSDGYDESAGKWGDYSLWIVSQVNRAVKSGQTTCDDLWKRADIIKNDIAAFKEHRKELGNNIDSFKSLDDLHDAVAAYIDGSGNVIPRDVTSKMSSRARTAIARMKRPGMSKVFENRDFLVTSPDNLEINRTMAVIGHWCHTGNKESGTQDADRYWKEYTAYGPLYYLLDKARGFVLCITASRQYEIENQVDRQPARIKPGSDEWTVYVEKKEFVPYDRQYHNNEEDWKCFFAWLDPAGGVLKAIEQYEKVYDEKQSEALKNAFFSEYGDIFKNANNGVLDLSDNATATVFKKLICGQQIEEPAEEDFEEGGQFEGEDFEEAQYLYQIMRARQQRENNIVGQLIQQAMSGVKSIKTGNNAEGLFQYSFYTGHMPVIDLDGAESCSRMFYGSSITRTPVFVNTSGVKDISYMFGNCTNLKDIGDMVFPSAVRIHGCIPYSVKIRSFGDIILPKATGRNFSNISIPGAVGDIDIRSVEDPVRFLGQLIGKNTRHGKIRVNPSAEPSSYWFYLPDDVIKDILEQTVDNFFSGLEKEKNGFFIMRGDQTRLLSALMYGRIIPGVSLTDPDIKVSDIGQCLRNVTDRYAACTGVPNILIPEKTFNGSLTPDDFGSFFKNGKIKPAYSGHIFVKTESGDIRRISDDELIASFKGQAPEEDSWFEVTNPATARYAAEHNDKIRYIDVTGFSGGGKDDGFRTWIRDYLHDTKEEIEFDDDGSVDYVISVKIPQIRMTRAQWDRRNDPDPIFDRSPNLAYEYGRGCNVKPNLKPPDFVWIAAQKREMTESRIISDMAYRWRYVF